MKIAQLRHFVVAAEELHFPRAAQKLDISRQKLTSSIAAIEAEYGRALFDRSGPVPRLTRAGQQALADAYEELAKPSTPPPAPPVPAGGKAKATGKGVGRGKVLKGQPKPFKKRQGR